jgi:hypothetical protein
MTATANPVRAYIVLMRAVLLLAAACTLTAAQDPREIVRRSVQLMDQNMAIARNYTFLERSETRELDSDAHVKTRKILLYDVTILEGSPYRRLVGKDDHPLSPEEERVERKKLADSIAQRRKETPAERARRIADWEKKRQREREPLDELPDAFNFQMAGEGQIDGRDAWIIDATPRSGYRGRSAMAKLFPKFRGKLWIDKADYQWVKTEAEATDNISWGLFIARLSKGARLDIQMTRVNDEVWLPKRIEAKASARLALVKKYRIESDTSFSNYRKFQVESRVVSATPQP